MSICAIKEKVFREVVKSGEAWTIKVGIKKLIGYMDKKKPKNRIGLYYYK